MWTSVYHDLSSAMFYTEWLSVPHMVHLLFFIMVYSNICPRRTVCTLSMPEKTSVIDDMQLHNMLGLPTSGM